MNSHRLAGIGMTSQRTRSRLIQRLRDKGIIEEKVLSVMESTPRHLFVDEALAHRAYEDTSLPIGLGQTISQPFIVARMTELLVMSGPLNKVLEIGTGCGYQTAILAQLAKRVFSIERVKPLHEQARARLKEIGYYNAYLSYGDGFQGLADEAPFDAIIVTAAPEAIPPALIEQLAEGGRMVIPVGTQNGIQELHFLQKNDGSIEKISVEEVRFVPLLGGTV